LLNSHNENPVVLSATGFLFGTKEITMTKKHNPTDKDIECFNEFCDQLEKEHGFKKVAPPKDAGTIVIFPGLDGKVDMIDAVEALYGINRTREIGSCLSLYTVYDPFFVEILRRTPYDKNNCLNTAEGVICI
jgi:hypothetical protein